LEIRLLAVAEAWVANPEEDKRKLAFEAGMEALSSGPAAWIALGAAWSGGSLVEEPNESVPPAPYLTAQAVRAAILTAIATVSPKDRRRCLDRAIQAALTLIEGG
jgi:hypothetical protein